MSKGRPRRWTEFQFRFNTGAVMVVADREFDQAKSEAIQRRKIHQQSTTVIEALQYETGNGWVKVAI